MEPVAGARTFATSGEAYDTFMGRYSRLLAEPFAALAGATPGRRALDVGCGPGALTGELVRRLGASAVAACDPSPSFVAACADRHPDVDVRLGSAERLPFADEQFEVVAAQLVLHFVSEPAVAASELRRVARPGGTIAACVWDNSGGMELLRAFWDAALELDPSAPDEQRELKYGREGELSQWLADAGFEDVTESTLSVRALYQGFDDLWSGVLAGIGPAGSYCVSLPASHREAPRAALFHRLGAPSWAFTLDTVARAGRAVRP